MCRHMNAWEMMRVRKISPKEIKVEDLLGEKRTLLHFRRIGAAECQPSLTAGYDGCKQVALDVSKPSLSPMVLLVGAV